MSGKPGTGCPAGLAAPTCESSNGNGEQNSVKIGNFGMEKVKYQTVDQNITAALGPHDQA